MARRGHGLTRALLVTLLCAVSLPFASPTWARTLTVCLSGCDFTTIAAALQEADDGDVITVGEGTYAGGFAIDKNVDLRGAGRDTTTIQGTGETSVIRISARANVAIEAVTITGGAGSPIGAGTLGGGGILNLGGLTLSDSVVRGNTAAAGEGGGIYSYASKPLKILNSIIADNQAATGGGVFVRNGDVVMEDTTVTGNQSTRDGGIAHQGGETLRLERCEIVDNRSDLDVGGVSSSSELVLIDSTVSGNRSSNVGGLAGGRKLLKIVRSTIRDNVSQGSGGGIRVGSGGVVLFDSVVEMNQTRRANGGGIFANNLSGDVSLRNSTISGNVAMQDGGGILNEKSEITLDNSKITNNQAGRLGGGIYSRTVTKGLIKVRNGSAIVGNEPDQCSPVSLRC